jgi:hypothetical protein
MADPLIRAFLAEGDGLARLGQNLDTLASIVEAVGRAATVSLSAPAWRNDAAQVRAAAESLQRVRRQRATVDGFEANPWLDVDALDSTLEDLQRRRDVFYRWFDGRYRRAVKRLRETVRTDRRFGFEDLVELAAALRTHALALAEHDLHSNVWDSLGAGDTATLSDDELGGIAALAGWFRDNERLLPRHLKLIQERGVERAREVTEAAKGELTETIKDASLLVDVTVLDVRLRFGVDAVVDVDLASLGGEHPWLGRHHPGHPDRRGTVERSASPRSRRRHRWTARRT